MNKGKWIFTFGFQTPWSICALEESYKGLLYWLFRDYNNGITEEGCSFTFLGFFIDITTPKAYIKYKSMYEEHGYTWNDLSFRWIGID